MKPTEKPTVLSVHDSLPPIEMRVMVVTEVFRCLGYRDAAGAWRYEKGGGQIENVIGWYPFLT